MQPGHPALRLAALRALMLPAALLLLGALLAGCGSTAPTAADEEQMLIDYRARHQRMLSNVMERPARLEAQRLERERQARVRAIDDWDRVMARQEGVVQEREQRRDGGQEQYQRILERQREYNDARDRARTEQWARYVEKNSPPPSEPGAGAP